MTPEEWFRSIPPITKGLFLTALALTLSTTFNLISTKYLFFSRDFIFTRLQLWRLVLPFLYFGNFSMPFLFQMYMLVNYTRSLEQTYYRGPRGKLDLFALFAYIVGACLLVDSFYEPLYFPASIFLGSLIYVWSRKDPNAGIVLYGFSLKAWHLPFVMVMFSLLMGGNFVHDIIAILIGHFYYFVSDVVPKRYKVTIAKFPESVYRYVDNLGDRMERSGDNVFTAASRPAFVQRGPGYRLGS